MGKTFKRLFAVSGILVAGLVEATQYQRPAALDPVVSPVALARQTDGAATELGAPIAIKGSQACAGHLDAGSGDCRHEGAAN